MKPKQKIIVIICSFLFVALLVVAFNFINSYLINSGFYDGQEIDKDGLVIAANAKGVYIDGDDNVDNTENINNVIAENYNNSISPLNKLEKCKKIIQLIK